MKLKILKFLLNLLAVAAVVLLFDRIIPSKIGAVILFLVSLWQVGTWLKLLIDWLLPDPDDPDDDEDEFWN